MTPLAPLLRLSRPARWLRFACLLACFAPLALAHNPIASWATVQTHPASLELKVEVATESAWLLLGESLETAPNVQGSLPRLAAMAADVYQLSVDGRVLAARESTVALREEDGVEFRLVFDRPATTSLHFVARYLQRLPADHRTSLTLLDESGRSVRMELLNPSNTAVDLALPALVNATMTTPLTVPSTPATVAAPPPVTVSFQAFFKLGVEHILTGYDHLLFLIGLLIVCRRFSSMAAIITCFTLAHSLTLALAALDVVSLPARVVEPLIAASIVFVGAENLFRRNPPDRRWLLPFGFGLIHGFGFAGVLREVGLGAGGGSLFMPLFSFNLGVEAGQLAVVLVVLPVLHLLRKRPDFIRYGEPAISGVVLLLGAYWLGQRTFFS